MTTTTRVAAWQCQPGPLDVAGNLRRLDAICAQAAAQQVEVLVTPEMFTSGYGHHPRAGAEPRRGRGRPDRDRRRRRSRGGTASRSSTATPSAPGRQAPTTRRR